MYSPDAHTNTDDSFASVSDEKSILVQYNHSDSTFSIFAMLIFILVEKIPNHIHRYFFKRLTFCHGTQTCQRSVDAVVAQCIRFVGNEEGRMMIQKWFLLAISLLILGSCGSDKGSQDSGSDGGSKTESYSYEFEENRCNTGKHTFSSMADYCKGLKDHTLNKGCAPTLRKNEFEVRKCPGSFV